MKSVNIAELKNRLSFYLSQVKAGQELVIRDRDRAVARIVPLRTPADEDVELEALEADGLILLGNGPLDEAFWQLPAPRVSAQAVRQAIREERDED